MIETPQEEQLSQLIWTLGVLRVWTTKQRTHIAILTHPCTYVADVELGFDLGPKLERRLFKKLLPETLQDILVSAPQIFFPLFSNLLQKLNQISSPNLQNLLKSSKKKNKNKQTNKQNVPNFHCFDKGKDKKQHGEKEVYLSLHILININNEEKSGQEFKVEIWSQEIKQRQWRSTTYWLPFNGLLSILSCPQQDQIPSAVTSFSMLPLHQSNYEPKVCHRGFFLLRFCPCRFFHVCFKLTKSNIHSVVCMITFWWKISYPWPISEPETWKFSTPWLSIKGQMIFKSRWPNNTSDSLYFSSSSLGMFH